MVEGNMSQLYEVNGKQRRMEGCVRCESPSRRQCLCVCRGVLCVQFVNYTPQTSLGKTVPSMYSEVCFLSLKFELL